VATLGLPDSPGVPAALAGLTLTLPFNDTRALGELFRRRGDTLAAVIVEPYVGNCGFIAPEPEFHTALRTLCDRHGALLIFDEVMTGFRVSAGGAQDRLHVRPDLTTLGKIIGGGMPVGAYGGRADLMRLVAPEGPVYQAGTLSGNPVAMAAGLATLRETERPGFYETLERRTARLVAGIGEPARPHGLAGAARVGWAGGAPRPAAPPLTPGAEPELRVGLLAGARSVTLGGDGGGELLLSDDSNGEPLGSIPAGTRWTVVADTPGVRLVKADGTPGEQRAGISAVNVTEHRFAMANGRRYRGRLNVIRDAAGLTLITPVPVESYLAGVIGGEMGARRPEERQAMLAQAVVSRTFALRNRGRWEPQGFDTWADVRDQVYTGISGETAEVWGALRATRGEVLR